MPSIRPWGHLTFELRTPSDGFQTVDQLEAFAEGIMAALSVPMPGRALHRFSPIGVSLARFGPGGRLAIHTWPELWTATLDLWAPRAVLSARRSSVFGWLELHANVFGSELETPDGSLVELPLDSLR